MKSYLRSVYSRSVNSLVKQRVLRGISGAKINTPSLINRIRRWFWKIYYSLLAITGLVSYQEYDVAARLHSLSGLVYCRLTIDEMFWTVQWSLFMSINKAWYRKDKLSVTLIRPYNNVDHLIGWCVSNYYIDTDFLITLLCFNDINAVTEVVNRGYQLWFVPS